jgi:hypothetical protein
MAAIRAWAIAWYREEDWAKWRAACPDFAPDYGQWLIRANAGFAKVQRDGYFPEKVMLDLDEFLEWSKSNGGKIDGNARSRYAVHVLSTREGPAH